MQDSRSEADTRMYYGAEGLLQRGWQPTRDVSLAAVEISCTSIRACAWHLVIIGLIGSSTQSYAGIVSSMIGYL